jgi:hypothetical protein
VSVPPVVGQPATLWSIAGFTVPDGGAVATGLAELVELVELAEPLAELPGLAADELLDPPPLHAASATADTAASAANPKDTLRLYTIASPSRSALPLNLSS